MVIVATAALPTKQIRTVEAQSKTVSLKTPGVRGVDKLSKTATAQLKSSAADFTYIMQENFDGATFPPAGWSIKDVDGDGHNWEAMPIYKDQPTDKAALSYSFINPPKDSPTGTPGTPLTPNNWLITKPIVIPATGAITLEYYTAALDPSVFEEKYSVKVSTTDSKVQSFTTTLKEEVLATGSLRRQEVDLNAYRGKTIYLAFVHSGSTDQFALVLDNVAVYDGVKTFDPIASFELVNGLYSFTSEDLVVYTTSLDLLAAVSTSENAENLDWSITPTAKIEVVPDNSGIFCTFPEDGTYTITLDASRESLKSTASKEFQAILHTGGEADVIGNIAADEKLTYYYFKPNEYVVGVNTNWSKVAERYTLVKGTKVKMSGIMAYAAAYALSPANQSLPVSLKVYDQTEKGGFGDVLYTVSGTMGELMAQYDPNTNPFIEVGFAKPLELENSFFISIEFPTFTPDANNYIGLAHSTERPLGYQSTAYAELEGEWVNMGNLLTNNFFISTTIMPVLEILPYSPSSVEQTVITKDIFVKDGFLTLSEVDGAQVAIYNMYGQLMSQQSAQSNISIDMTDYAKGMYVVSINKGDSKQVVKVMR